MGSRRFGVICGAMLFSIACYVGVAPDDSASTQLSVAGSSDAGDAGDAQDSVIPDAGVISLVDPSEDAGNPGIETTGPLDDDAGGPPTGPADAACDAGLWIEWDAGSPVAPDAGEPAPSDAGAPPAGDAGPAPMPDAGETAIDAGGPQPVGGACGSGDDCATGHCSADSPGGYCTQSCNLFQSCPEGSSCTGWLFGGCAQGCGSDDDCRDDYTCQWGMCLAARCHSNHGCPPDRVCDSSQHYCVRPPS